MFHSLVGCCVEAVLLFLLGAWWKWQGARLLRKRHMMKYMKRKRAEEVCGEEADEVMNLSEWEKRKGYLRK